jgi:integrase
MQLYDTHGRRKYLTPSERHAFIESAKTASGPVATFCSVLAYTGCRISEALALSSNRVDLTDGVLIFESLKKRHRGVYRAVPVPPTFLLALGEVHGLKGNANVDRLWPWSRATGWRHVRNVMRTAHIEGTHASPKGLRHGFGIKAVVSGVPLNLLQKWLGHARLSTTAIYADAIGPEEKQIAERMWT